VGSSAERIGVELGDIIMKMGEYKIQTAEELIALVQHAEPNEAFNIVLLRKGRRLGGTLMIE
jgi:S1-C subfamily serine protease